MERDKLKKDVTIAKKPTGVFYVEGNRGFFYDQTMPSPLSLNFSPDIISDLEIISKKKLNLAIQAFIGAYKIVPKSIIILLSPSVTFDKDFPLGSVQMDKNIKAFLDLVPFQESISKQSKLPGKIKVVAANREMSEAIKNSFADLGFPVSAIIPLSSCLEILPQLKANLDLGLILDKATELRDYSLSSDIFIPESSQKKDKKDNKKLLILSGVFGVLLLILLFVLYKSILSTPKSPAVLPTTTVIPSVPTVFEEPATPSGQINSSSNF